MDWNLVFSAVVTGSTVTYAGLTWWLTVETRRMRRIQTEPKVGVSLVQSPNAIGFVDMIVRNDGAGPALDVRFAVVETGHGPPDAELRETLQSSGLVQSGIPYLSPGADFRTFLTAILGRKTIEEARTNIHLRVRYTSATHEKYEDCYPLDLTQFWNRAQVGRPFLEEIVRELRALRGELEEWRQTLRPRA